MKKCWIYPEIFFKNAIFWLYSFCFVTVCINNKKDKSVRTTSTQTKSNLISILFIWTKGLFKAYVHIFFALNPIVRIIWFQIFREIASLVFILTNRKAVPPEDCMNCNKMILSTKVWLPHPKFILCLSGSSPNRWILFIIYTDWAQ